MTHKHQFACCVRLLLHDHLLWLVLTDRAQTQLIQFMGPKQIPIPSLLPTLQNLRKFCFNLNRSSWVRASNYGLHCCRGSNFARSIKLGRAALETQSFWGLATDLQTRKRHLSLTGPGFRLLTLVLSLSILYIHLTYLLVRACVFVCHRWLAAERWLICSIREASRYFAENNMPLLSVLIAGEICQELVSASNRFNTHSKAEHFEHFLPAKCFRPFDTRHSDFKHVWEAQFFSSTFFLNFNAFFLLRSS
jgi:hypothetical protein